MDSWLTRRRPIWSAVLPPKTPAELVYLLDEVGAYEVNFLDNDLIPIDATSAKFKAIKNDFR